MEIPKGRFWAKYDATTGRWHPLIAHSADVAAVLSRLLADDSPFTSRLAQLCGRERLAPEVRAVLVYLAVLHDLGKVNHGFQDKCRPRGSGQRWPADGHVKVFIESIEVCPPLQTLIPDILSPIAGNLFDKMGLFMAVLCHHGRPYDINLPPVSLARIWDPAARPGWDPPAMIKRLIHYARRWSGLDELSTPIEVPLTPEFSHLFAGLITLADWVGSTESIFRLTPEADDDPDAYWSQARERAHIACAQIGLIPETRIVVRPGTELLRQLFPNVFGTNSPTPLQRRVAEMPLPGRGSRILIESETGSGKTEAVLALYARLRAAGLVSGLVFALPTRATASAMHERVLSVLSAAYPSGPKPTVALAMGGKHLRMETNERTISELPRTYDERERDDLYTWASSSAKKFFAAEIVVGTIDQVLLGGLLVRHAHLRLAMLNRHLLVVDELHSCDRYMAEVLAKIVDFHTRAGGIVAFMSATLSALERSRYGGSPLEPTLTEAIDRPYPVISICDASDKEWRDETLDDGTPPRSRLISWSTATERDGLTAAIDAAKSGACVCVLRNTVKDARASIAKISELGGAPFLWRPAGSMYTPAYHSRYTQPDRLALDAAVLASYGKNGRAKGTILVATQVVEQSLDVDFDFMVTDLCPIDVLLQRIGRLHRHHRERPRGFENARILVLAPEKPLIEYHHGDRLTGPHGWGPVYEDVGDLELTLRLIQSPDHQTISIPAQNRELIERVYHHEPRELLAKESTRWENAFIVNEGKNLGRAVHADGASIDFSKSYMNNSSRYEMALEHKIRSRLGEDLVRIDLDFDLPYFYADPDRAIPVRHVDLPCHVVVETEQDGTYRITDVKNTSESIQFTVNGRRMVHYDAQGWHW